MQTPDRNEGMAILQLSQHVAIGISPEVKKRSGCYLILALDYHKPEWGQEPGAIGVTLCSSN
jgi:hypothetical protein